MALRQGYKALLEEANAKVQAVKPEEAEKMLARDDVTFVDLRDVRELDREGMIPGALHAPRGMLEFWIDPESPYYKEAFGSGNTFVFYCQSAWRSALATQTAQEMGLEPVCHLEGGYKAWKDAGKPTAERRKPEEKK